MIDVGTIFSDYRRNKSSFEAVIGLYGLLTLRKAVADKSQVSVISTYDDQFKEYASMLKQLQIADAAFSSGQFQARPNGDDVDFYVSQTGLEGFGVGPLAWVLLIAGIGAGYAVFKSAYEWLRQRGREQESTYQAWFSTLPSDVRQDVEKMDEHARAEAAAPGIFAQLRDLGKASLDIAAAVGIALGAILLFKLLGAMDREKEKHED